MDDSDDEKTEVVAEVVLTVQSVESSVTPPIEEWSSLEMKLPEENVKKLLYEEGLYDPGNGEMCAEYMAMSASSVFRHPYFNYPGIVDPGIQKALFKPEPAIIFSHDGQAKYLHICKEMKQCPIRIFYKGLVDSKDINLSYYCVNPDGVRAMAKALEYNKKVEVLNLTDNFLHVDACFHLGEMLSANSTLTELNLRGCRIGPQGAKRLFCSLPVNRALKVLDLSHNKLGDDGMEYVANAVLFGLNVKNLNLSYNNITGKGVALLVEPFEAHNKFTHLDLSWNTIFTVGCYAFLIQLSDSANLQVLNLSWNSLAGPRISQGLKEIMLNCPLLSELNLSNNLLKEDAIKHIVTPLAKAKKLATLNLSFNPMTPTDAYNILSKVGMKTCKIKNLLMDNVVVNENFLILLGQLKQMKAKKNIVVTYGGVATRFIPKGVDMRDLVLNRIEFVTRKMKKAKADVALIALQLQKDNNIIMPSKDLVYAFRRGGAVLDDDLIEELASAFLGPPDPKSPKLKNINIDLLVDFIHRKWPDRKLPPTPPPEPEPEPEKEKKKGKKQK